MADRSFILSSYRQLLTDCWRKGRILLDDIHSIQVFCEVHQITLEEHRLVVRGDDRPRQPRRPARSRRGRSR